MVTTRRQEAAENGGPPAIVEKPQVKKRGPSKKQSKGALSGKSQGQGNNHDEKAEAGTKRDVEETKQGGESIGGAKEEEPPVKKARVEDEDEEQRESGVKNNEGEKENDHPAQHMYQSGTIERGHIYFFYRPRVELEEVHSVDDVQRFHILLVPRPPEFSAGASSSSSTNIQDVSGNQEQEMNVVEAGRDAVPAPPVTDQKKKPFRLIVVGKKSLPDPDAGGGGRKAIFWGTVTTVGNDLAKLQDGLGAKEYETKTKGTRHQGPARIAGRGAYAIVNNEAPTPSKRETHMGYHLSHPTPDHFGEVQEALGIHSASSFVIQVKNPDAPNVGPAQVGLPKNRRTEFSDAIMKDVFGQGGARGRESYGLRFASVERREMLDSEGAELLFIAARSGDKGLEASLGEGRGQALTEAEQGKGKHPIDSVLKELAIDSEKIPAAPLEGEWE